MKRRSPGEAAFVAVLAVLGLLALALHANLALDGRLTWVPLYVAPADGPHQHPVVRGFWPDTAPDATTLRPGDALRAVGSRSLAGAGRIDVLAAIQSAADAGRARFEVARAGGPATAELALRPFAAPWRTIPLALALGVTAMLVWMRAPDLRAARAYASAAAAYALHWTVLLGGGGWQTRLGFWLLVVTGALFPPLTLRAIRRFPRGAQPPGALDQLWPWGFAAIGPLLASWLVGAPLPGPLGLSLLLAGYGAFVACVLVVLARTYRRADAVGRRQLRWVLLGFYLALAPVGLAAALAAWQPASWSLYEASLAATPLIPICVAVALIRFNLFDIDRLISATAAFSILSVLFLSMLFTAVPVVAAPIARSAGVEPQSVQIVLAVALATGLIRSEAALRPRLERIFFRERHALEVGMRSLRAELHRARDPDVLFETLGRRLSELLQLDTCAIYARFDATFAPIFAHGAAIPPALDARRALAGLLDAAGRPVGARQLRRWIQAGHVSDLEAGQLASLGVEVMVPIRDEELRAFVCLGGKGSEDVYTPVDLALLDGLGDRLSVELRRFDAAAVARTERERWERLAGYVPAAVVSEVDRPTAVAPGEREVTVLFVDIRGYTALSEGRSPDEIFQIVNAYTTAVSRVVRDHGGWVVEFHGDGLLAVFGAPTELPHKERAAVEAGLRLVEEIERKGLPELPGLPLRVGVGVATGPAYVGNVRSVDRQIWCVIGNTTNLAARLQAMTRELEASLVIDDVTRERNGPGSPPFEMHARVHVRGRSVPMTVWAAPRARAAAAA